MRSCIHSLFSGLLVLSHEILGVLLIACSLGSSGSAHEVVNTRIFACSLGTPMCPVLLPLAFSLVFSVTALIAQPNTAEARALRTYVRMGTLT